MEPDCLNCGHPKSDHHVVDYGGSTRGIVCQPQYEGDDLGACSCTAPSYLSSRVTRAAEEDMVRTACPRQFVWIVNGSSTPIRCSRCSTQIEPGELHASTKET